MKHIFKYLAGACLAGFAAAACSPEKFEGADEGMKPSIEGYTVKWDADYETNTVTASVENDLKGCYPVWEITWTNAKGEDQQSISTAHELTRQFQTAGTYNFSLKIGNRHGVSDGAVTKSFTFDKTLVNWSEVLDKICGKEWRIDYDEQGHMGCGPAYSTGDGWWSAAPGDKKDFGVYDDRVTFEVDPANPAGGTYSYNPGADGLVYVNKGTTYWGATPNEGEDFDTAVEAQTSSFSLSTDFYTPDGSSESVQATYITLGSKTLFPYISSDAQYDTPKYRVESYSSKKMVLVYDEPGISWRFILTSTAEQKGFNGFDANSDFNMFKGAEIGYGFYYADAGWSQLPDPEYTEGNNSITLSFPTANQQQWQSQVFMTTDIATSASSNYDFSVLLTPNKDIKGVTVKLTQSDNDDVYYFADRIDLTANTTYIFWKSDMAGIDIPALKLVFDFGGCPENFEVEIANIVLKDHANDDGTVLPDPDAPEPVVFDWDYNSDVNLWKAVDAAEFEYTTWFADASWTAYDRQPEVTREGDAYTIVMLDPTAAQWQAQFKIKTKIAGLTAKKDSKYNLYCLVESDKDLGNVTFKLTEPNWEDTSKENNFFFAATGAVEADVQYVFKQNAVQLAEKDAEELVMVFDFGGNPENTTVKISKIYFEEVSE